MKVHIIHNEDAHKENEYEIHVRNKKQPLHVLKNNIKKGHRKNTIVYTDYLTQLLNSSDIYNFKNDIKLSLSSSRKINIKKKTIKTDLEELKEVVKDITIEWSSYELEYNQ